MNPPPDQREPKTLSRVSLGILLIFVVAAFVRIYDLGERGLWVDEFFSLAGSAGRYPDLAPLKLNEVMRGLPSYTDVDEGRPWWTIWPQMREETHPPLYIILLRFWRELFGNGDVAAQAFSVLCSLAALGLLWDTARRLWGHGVAMWAAVLMAVAWPQVHYAQEVRPYALLMALGTGAMNALVRIETESAAQRRRHWLLQAYLAAMLLAMALTHYFAAGALLAVGAHVLARMRGRMLRDMLMTCAVAAGVFMIVWGPSMWAQRHNTSYDFLENTHARPALVTLARADQLPVRYLVDADWRPMLPGTGVVVLVGGALLVWKKDRRLMLPLFWLAGTAGFITLLDLARSTQHLHLTRYTVLASPALYLLVPAALYALRPVAAHVVCGVLVALSAAALPYYYLNERENWRGWALALKEAAQPGRGVILAHDAQGKDPWYATTLFIAMSHYAHDRSRPVLVIDRPATSEALRQMGAGRVWMVYGTPGGRQITLELLQRMAPSGRIGEIRPFSTAVLCEVELP